MTIDCQTRVDRRARAQNQVRVYVDHGPEQLCTAAAARQLRASALLLEVARVLARIISVWRGQEGGG